MQHFILRSSVAIYQDEKEPGNDGGDKVDKNVYALCQVLSVHDDPI